jgi:hypothetical protein
MNFQWREGVHGQCALYEELIRDDGKVLGCIMRFYEENCPTYAMTETERLGPKRDETWTDRQIRRQRQWTGPETNSDHAGPKIGSLPQSIRFLTVP